MSDSGVTVRKRTPGWGWSAKRIAARKKAAPSKHGIQESLPLFGSIVCYENDLKGPKNSIKLQQQEKLESQESLGAAGKQQLNLGVTVSNLKTNFSLYSEKISESTVDSTFQSHRHLSVY
jgi:hypothetical protein